MNISHLPNTPGVYIMRDNAGTILYIGKAKNVHKRVSQYFLKNAGDSSWKTPNLTALIREIDYISCLSEREALIFEKKLIQKFKPFFNALWKNGKSYPYVKITNEDYPRLTLSRKKPNDRAAYFGPYPKIEAVRTLLNYLWRIKYINLRRCKHDFSESRKLSERKIRACVYYHTSQCPAPCSGKISKKDYAKIADRTTLFLKGDFSSLLSNFSKKMKAHSKKLEYEKAKLYRDFIKAIEHLSQKVRIKQCAENILTEELPKTKASTKLKNVLNLKTPPSHIEAFDTSSLFSKNAVGSSVCFIDAQKNPPHYRKYKIKYSKPLKHGSNDFEMIKEIVKRRLNQIKKSKIGKPDLFLIDGGKGQLNAALKAMREASCNIPVIALAKKNEEIYIPLKKHALSLKKNDPALLLLQRVRDESHRFAVSYHRKLRDLKLIKE